MIAFVILMGSLAWQEPEPVAVEVKDLSPKLEDFRESKALPALAAALWQDGHIVAEGAVGLRAVGQDAKVTTEDLWHLGSDTKAMTAVLMAVLVEEGKLSWQSTIGEVFADLEKEIHDDWSEVTLTQLLRHRSGFAEDRVPDAVIFPAMRKLTGPMREQRRSFVKMALASPPAQKPGTVFQYSNFGYMIAGAMAEAVCQKSWESLMKERVFAPLGMSTAGFGPPGVEKELLQPMGHYLGVPVPFGPAADNPAVLGPAGTVHASLEDWGKFLNLFLTTMPTAEDVASGKAEKGFLTAESMSMLKQPGPGGYAMGWITAQREWGGGAVLSHAGSNGMWFAVTWVAPNKGFAAMAVTNCATAKGIDACDEVIGALIRLAQR